LIVPPIDFNQEFDGVLDGLCKTGM
jgi:hypothetical protein